MGSLILPQRLTQDPNRTDSWLVPPVKDLILNKIEWERAHHIFPG